MKREGPYIYLWLIHVDKWQKPTQQCKTILLQLKIINLKNKTKTKDILQKDALSEVRKYILFSHGAHVALAPWEIIFF